MLDFLANNHNMKTPDAIFLEYAVNDYEGQDDRTQLFFIEDVFFDGFQEIATCAEGIVRGLYEKFPDIFLMFAEFKTAIERRQTAQFLHMAVAQHYDVPVVSYADAVLLPFYHQVRCHRVACMCRVALRDGRAVNSGSVRGLMRQADDAAMCCAESGTGGQVGPDQLQY
jgi:hypothetical protein